MQAVTEIISILQILTFIVAVTSGFFLIKTSSKKRPTTYIGLFLIAFSTDTIVTLLVNFNVIIGREYLYFLPLNFWFLSAALLYFYARELTRPLKQDKKLLHLIPGFTEFIVLSVLFIFGLSGVLDMGDISKWYDGIAYYFEASVVYALGYYILISWTVRKTRKGLGNEFSNVKWRELKWLETVCYLSIITMLSWVVVSYIESFELFNKLKFIVYVFNMLTIGYIIYNAFRQQSLGLDEELYESINIDEALRFGVSEPENSLNMGSEDLKTFARIQELMEEQKLYLDPDLKLHDLAHSVKSPSRKLSQLIQAQSGNNFRSFVNEYRVKEAKNLLRTDLAQQLNMEGIAKESGFSSRTTFYTAFKSISGCSPREYAQS